MAKPQAALDVGYEGGEEITKCGYRKIAANLDPFDMERNASQRFRQDDGGREVDWSAEDRKNAKKPRDATRR